MTTEEILILAEKLREFGLTGLEIASIIIGKL